ncbi:hypothetical protein H1Q63_00435 [Desmonostoc muscorum CCALA 125]|jgi:hypothetical protein|uniref:DUF6753 family protein n=1 Tax=unclassified Nostoc TaxID=2593658 RepID=UPI0015C31916|nr:MULTISPECIES: DUF6753 family protein [unclassified Nostoc]MBX9252468.1 hypothetical protein [Desmonostoc muscorum CCALA 125]MEA5600552.1 DUF6753 family protein [Nostoc sp. UHCC 0252]QLE52826.1 hypothetical protein FD724_33185 [Nostoc sp. C057]
MSNSHTEELDLDDEFLDSVAARGKGLSQIPYPTLLDLAIRGKDDSFKARVWEIVVQTGLDPDDPAFLMMIATGRLQVLLEDNPKEMEAMFDLWQTQLYDHLQTYEKAAVKGQQKAIAQAVTGLIRRTEFERAIHSVPSLIAAGILLLIAAGVGGLVSVGGMSWYQSSHLDPAGPRQLTQAQANALEWATSNEGKFAHNLMQWNQDLLSRDQNGQLTCAKDVKRLGVTLEIGASSRKASSGFCTLWTSPSNQRQFVSKPRLP